MYHIEDVNMDMNKPGSKAALDHNHTHFLLVDNGTQYKYQAEIEFRARLESFISEKVETGVTEQQSKRSVYF